MAHNSIKRKLADDDSLHCTPKVKLNQRDHLDAPRLNDFLSSPEFKASYKKNVDSELNECIFINNPFKCCVVSHFIKNDDFLNNLIGEIKDIPMIPKNNDLYKFHQSCDLKNIKTQKVELLKTCLYHDFKNIIQDVTDIQINDTVDLNVSSYKHTDTLLCHDDRLEGRVIAFILYLVTEWNEKFGGSFDMFNCDDKNEPTNVTRSFLPAWNQLVFFEVSHMSYHQVSEVLVKNKERLSISGWLHGTKKGNIQPDAIVGVPSVLISPEEFEEEDFYSWINPMYLDPSIQEEIKEQFEDSSEIQLDNFLQPLLYQELCDALKIKNLQWMQKGPANIRNYEILDQSNYPEIVAKCVRFFSSEALFLVLSQLTGLTLQDGPNCSSSMKGPCCSAEMRKWKHKSYTLIHDNELKMHDYTLDGAMYFNCNHWSSEMGGHTTYITEGEDEELLTICPKSNSFSLVYRDHQTLRFVKYINCLSQDINSAFVFNDLSLCYYEKQ